MADQSDFNSATLETIAAVTKLATDARARVHVLELICGILLSEIFALRQNAFGSSAADSIGDLLSAVRGISEREGIALGGTDGARALTECVEKISYIAETLVPKR